MNFGFIIQLNIRLLSSSRGRKDQVAIIEKNLEMDSYESLPEKSVTSAEVKALNEDGCDGLTILE